MRLDVPQECWETKRAGTRAAVLTVPFDSRYPVPPPLDQRLTETLFFQECDCPPDFPERATKLDRLQDDGGGALPLLPQRERLREELLSKQSAWEEFSQWCKSGTGAAMVTGERGCGKTVFLRRCAREGLGGSVWILLTPNLDPGTIRLYEEVLQLPREPWTAHKLKAAMAAWMCSALSGEGRLETYGDPAKGWELLRTFPGAPGQNALLPKLSAPVRQLISMLGKTKTEKDPSVGRRAFSQLWIRYLQTLCATPGGGVDGSFRYVTELFVLTVLWRFPRKRIVLVFDELDTGVGSGCLHHPVPVDVAAGLLHIAEALLPTRCKLIMGMGKDVQLPADLQTALYILDVSGWASLKEIMQRKLHFLRKNSVVLQDAYQPRDLLAAPGCSTGRVDELLRELDRLFAWEHRELYDFLCRMYSDRAHRTMLRRCVQLQRNPNLPGHRGRFLYRSVLLHLVCRTFLRDGALSLRSGESEAEPPMEQKLLALAVLLTLLSSCRQCTLEELLAQAGQYCTLDEADLLRLLTGFARIQEKGPLGLRLFRMNSDHSALRGVAFSTPEELEQTLSQELPPGAITVSLGPSGQAFLEQMLPEPALCACLCGFREPLAACIPQRPRDAEQEPLPCVLYVSGLHSMEQQLLLTAKALEPIDGGKLHHAIREEHSAWLDQICGLALHTWTDRPDTTERAALVKLTAALCSAWGRPDQETSILAQVEREYNYFPEE